MNYSETLKYIHSLGMFSHEAGLQRIKALLKRLGNPQDKFKSVHIAGTNGKGSTAAFTSFVFREAGYKTGLFISPFIIDFRERIQINGSFIDKKRLCELSERVKECDTDVTEFEFITAVAFLYFAEENVDIAVIETGLGGRFDATNTLGNTCVSAITKIGLDHTAILGNTFKKIAYEKCGIIKNAVTVTAVNQHRTALDVIRKSAEQLIIPDRRHLKIINTDISGNEFCYRKNHYKTRLGGDYQIDNALTAIEIVRNSGFGIEDKYLISGINKAQFPARLEVMHENPLVVLDGAHNPDGAQVLKKAMMKYNGKINAIVGMMKDKNCDSFLKEVLPLCKCVTAVTLKDMPRALDSHSMAKLCSKYCKNTEENGNIENALRNALSNRQNEPVFIFGSLYLASFIRPLLLDL